MSEANIVAMLDIKKHLDSPLGSFCDKIYCRCPHCDKQAVITAKVEYAVPLISHNVRMQCLSCAYRRIWATGKLYGKVEGTAQQRCPNCGHKWLSAKIYGESHRRLKNSVSVVCSYCKQQVVLGLTWHNVGLEKDAVDPYFGSPLWLQTECSGKRLCAFNEAHLFVLKSYVEATLRDGRLRGKWAMSARLPTWLTSAKNRQAMLKCINRLEQMLID